MNAIGDVGISPVLLQAINQTLTSTASREVTVPSTGNKRHWKKTLTMDNSNGNSAPEDLVSQILQTGSSSAPPKTSSETIKQMLKMKIEPGTQLSHSASKESAAETSSSYDVAMASVLSSLATQHQISKTISTTTGQSGDDGKQQFILCYPTEKTVSQSEVGKDGSQTKTILFDEAGNQILLRTTDSIEEDQSEKDKGQDVLRGHSAKISESLVPETPVLQSDTIKTMLKMRLGGGQMSSGLTGTQSVSKVEPTIMVPSGGTDLSMVNVLTALAAQQLQTTAAQGQVALDTGQPVTTATSVADEQQKRLIICYQRDQDGGSPLQQSVIVSEGGMLSEGASILDQEGGQRVILQSSGLEADESGIPAKVVRLSEDGAYTVSQADLQNMELNSGSNVTVQTDPNARLPTTPCPVCGDYVSGYHYGIFTCESCKGFFKRTVQNKKTFLCHRQGECEITLENRKKCPACRFAKCLVMGMKLEAIRADRTRGGRSSYSGPQCQSPQSVKPVLPVDRKRPKPVRRSESGTSQTYISIPETSQGASQLVAILNHGNQVTGMDLNVPQILTDIMNLESLLCDDELPPEVAADNLSPADPSVFFTLLQLTELKLYKIVRWARNLPYFSNISTDDQILLLQNCWCELLTLTSCWRSIHLTNEVVFLHGQSINEEKAQQLGVADMFAKILFLIDHLRRLHVDQYEVVALKVLILITPDMKGVKDGDKLREQQERITEALEKYTSSHYRQSPNKFGELLLRLPELARVSTIMKEHLMSWMPENSTSCGLLYELLKGENMKDLG